ncbi:hypothetical protein H8E06_00975 [bacterium]|nr:hypothetical protein [bacterium]
MSDEEKCKIQQFIGSVTEKNYAQANKYLKEVLDSKMRTRISQVTNKPIFK